MANNMTSEAKNKFGLLINYLVDSGFSYEYIQHQIIHNKYFLFFENNDLNSFLNKPIENIINEVFGKQIYIDYAKPISSEIFWAGQMYITLLLNYQIPIQRSFLVYPLEKMIDLFNPYHEMNESQLCDRYLEDEKHTSVFRLLIDESVTIRQLSIMTSISQRTLISYMNNERLYSMTLANASTLSNFFDVTPIIFTKISNYSPDIAILLNDDGFRDCFLTIIEEYTFVPKDEIEVISSVEDKHKTRELLTRKKLLINISNFTLIKKYNNAVKYISLSKKVIEYLSNKTIVKFKESLPKGTLLF